MGNGGQYDPSPRDTGPRVVSLDNDDDSGVRFIFRPDLFAPGRYKIVVLWDQAEGGVTYMRRYEVIQYAPWPKRIAQWWKYHLGLEKTK